MVINLRYFHAMTQEQVCRILCISQVQVSRIEKKAILRLRELLKIADDHEDYRFLSGDIIAWDSSNWSSSFTINKGEEKGVAVGMCAVTEFGQVIGLVTEAGTNWATVTGNINTDDAKIIGMTPA